MLQGVEKSELVWESSEKWKSKARDWLVSKFKQGEDEEWRRQ